MLRLALSATLWARLKPTLVAVGIYDSSRLRLTIEGILWCLRTGCPWRDLPASFGPWSSVYNQFNRWSRRGIWKKVFESLRLDIDNEWNFMDGTIVKAHQHASGGRKDEEAAIGRSRGGLTTKVHMLADASGNPITFELTAGQVHDVSMAETLIESSQGETMITDKGYDCERVREKARSKGMVPIIPRKCNSSKDNPDFDKHLYRLRHLVENLFARLKHMRAIATRYDKLKRNFASCVFLGCILLWLRL